MEKGFIYFHERSLNTKDKINQLRQLETKSRNILKTLSSQLRIDIDTLWRLDLVQCYISAVSEWCVRPPTSCAEAAGTNPAFYKNGTLCVNKNGMTH